MLYRPLDAQGDMRPIQQKSQLLDGLQAVAAALQTRLRFYLGEWWEDTSQGFPLLDALFAGSVKESQRDALDHLITGYILETQGVTSVEGVALAFANRQMTYTCQVKTTDGTVSLEVTENGVSSTVSG